MKKPKCISCGAGIRKCARTDANICRDCEHSSGTELSRYAWLDR